MSKARWCCCCSNFAVRRLLIPAWPRGVYCVRSIVCVVRCSLVLTSVVCFHELLLVCVACRRVQFDVACGLFVDCWLLCVVC